MDCTWKWRCHFCPHTLLARTVTRPQVTAQKLCICVSGCRFGEQPDVCSIAESHVAVERQEEDVSMLTLLGKAISYRTTCRIHVTDVCRDQHCKGAGKLLPVQGQEVAAV